VSDPRWDDPRDRDEDSRDIDIHWIELGREGASDPRDASLRIATRMFAHETGIRATATHATCFSKLWNYRGDGNARSS